MSEREITTITHLGERFNLGPYTSYQIRHTPNKILFALSRYKFAMKMIGPGKSIIELGCNEGLGSYCLSEFASSVLGIDFDKEAIKWAKEHLAGEKLAFKCDDFINKEYGSFDAVVSYDVIEHIYEQEEQAYFETVVRNLNKNGVFVIGTPNIESERFSDPKIKGAHVNLYSGDRLTRRLSQYFHNVFLFSQNDEMIHTGYIPMAHYLICLCCSKK